MPKAIKKCRVCGKEYEACRSAKVNVGVFRWQEVACSPECGEIYLLEITESRAAAAKKAAAESEGEAPAARAADPMEFVDDEDDDDLEPEEDLDEDY